MARPKSLSKLSVSDLEKILEQRRSELKKLAEQRNHLHSQLSEVEARMAAIGGKPALDRRGEEAPASEAPARRPRKRRGSRVQNKISLPNAMFEVLTKAQGPLPVSDIVKGVQDMGYRSNAASFRSLVNQSLIKDKRFVAKSRGVYQIRK